MVPHLQTILTAKEKSTRAKMLISGKTLYVTLIKQKRALAVTTTKPVIVPAEQMAVSAPMGRRPQLQVKYGTEVLATNGRIAAFRN